MVQAAQALIKEYPAEFNTSNLGEHIEDLLFRFRNKALGDTIFRVGRDLYRKLSKEDRLIGAMLLGARQKCVTSEIAQAVRAAMSFRGTDEHGNMFAPDKEFAEKVFPQGVEHVLSAVCGLSSEDGIENAVMKDILDCAF